MEVFMAIVIGALFAGGVYMMLRPNLLRIVIGLGLLSNGTNLLMITCGGYGGLRDAPFMIEGADPSQLMDPLPPDIILTAIVINFAVGALFLIVAYVVYRDFGTANPDKLPPPSDAT